MTKITTLIFAVSMLTFGSCKRCKYCTEYQYGVRKGTQEYCGEQLKYVDGDYSETYQNGWICVEN